MAKKILKRSLALGALMAFVITGSAMAGDIENDTEYKDKTLDSYCFKRINNQGAFSGVTFENINITSSLAIGSTVYIYNKSYGGPLPVTFTDSSFVNNTASAKLNEGWAYGGAIGAKGTNLVLNDVLFVGNKTITTVENSLGLAVGGAIVLDALASGEVYYPSTLTLNISKDMKYYGNNVEASSAEAWNTGFDTACYSSGGFLYMDRSAVANFNIADGATLTIGNTDASGNMDTIASSIPTGTIGGTNVFATINKVGKGTLTINSHLNDYYGYFNVNEGTLNLSKDWNLKNKLEIAGGATVNVANIILDDIDSKTVKGNTTVSNVGSIVAKGATVTATSITNDIDGGVVSFTNSNFEGKITTGAGESNLTFGNGNIWNVTGASSVTSANFGEGSTLKIKGADFTDKYAITGKVTMAPTASLVIDEYTTDTAYKVVKGENNIAEQNLAYDRTQYFAEEITGSEYQVTFKDFTDATGDQVTNAQNQAVAATGGDALAAPGIIKGAIGSDAPAGAKDLVSAITSSGASIDQKAEMVNAVAKIGEAGGTTANAASVVNNVTGITTQRMSFTNVSTTPQGGHGKVERKYKSGAGVWAQYMHGKDKVEDMPSAGGANSYDSQYNGAVIGYDFKEVGKTHSGISFNYGEGDSHSKDSIVSTRNDFDFWGVGAYTSIMNDDTNLIFDINYNKSDADVKQIVAGHEVTVNPNTTSFSVGVKAEKLIQNGPVQIVPYAGARFLTIDTDEYTSSAGSVYNPERQNIWLIPVGVSLRQENVYENGWKVTPKADLSYIWALGDTDSSMTVTTGAASDPIAYTVMDNGSFLGTLGIEAEKGDWAYGLSYSYQKGEYQRSDKWFVDVRYSF